MSLAVHRSGKGLALAVGSADVDLRSTVTIRMAAEK